MGASRRASAEARKASRDVEALLIDDAATMKALAEPMRLQILLEISDEAKTVKEVANALEVGVTRLYYHFNILARAGLIRVAGRRMVSGIEERRYIATAQSWRPSPEATPSLVESGIVAAMLGMVEAELDLALAAQSPTPLGEPGSPVPILSLTRLALSEDEVVEVQKRIESVIEEFTVTKKPAEGQKLYGALFVGYQAPSELKAEQRPREEAS